MTDQAPQNQNYRDDEIDLRKLFQAIGNFFINIGRSFVRLIIAIRRVTFNYKVLLIAAAVVGLLAGVAANQFLKPYYKTSMLLRSGYLNAKLVDNSLTKLNLLTEEEEKSGLAKVLGISEEVAENIVEFEFEPFVAEADVVEIELLKQKLEDLQVETQDIDRVIRQIDIENRNTFMISVLVNDVTIIENLEEALVSYFRDNPFVANRIKTNRERLEQLIAKLTNDVAMLDSLKTAYNLNLKLQAEKPGSDATNNVYLGESGAVNPVTVYYQGINLFEQLQNNKRTLELGSDFEVVDGFTTFSKPESPGLLKSMVIGAGILLGLAYLLIILVEVNKYLNRVEKEGFGV